MFISIKLNSNELLTPIHWLADPGFGSTGGNFMHVVKC